MTLRPRPPKPPTSSGAALEHRARWGGLLPGVPPLTDAERVRWRAFQESQPTWVPRRALNYLWSRCDPLHGDGGLYADDGEEPWRIERFRAALDQDRVDIARVVAQYRCAPRLAQWALDIEALAHQRETDPVTCAVDAGEPMYARLIALGYDGREDPWDDD